MRQEWDDTIRLEPGVFQHRQTNDERFAEWMRQVDAALETACSLSSLDLPDCPYRDWWEDDYTPQSAAKKAIRMANDF